MNLSQKRKRQQKEAPLREEDYQYDNDEDEVVSHADVANSTRDFHAADDPVSNRSVCPNRAELSVKSFRTAKSGKSTASRVSLKSIKSAFSRKRSKVDSGSGDGNYHAPAEVNVFHDEGMGTGEEGAVML